MTLLGLLACGAGVAEVDGPVEVVVEPSVHVPMVPVVRSASAHGVLVVEGPEGRVTVEGDLAAGVPVVGLWPDTAYTFRVDGAETTWRTPSPPTSLAQVEVSGSGSAMGPDDGVLMAIATQASSYVAVLDAAGRWRWWFEADAGLTVASPRPTLDGAALLFAQHERERAQDLSVATTVRWDGTLRHDVRTETGHHMVAERPDGRLAWLGHTVERRTLDGLEADVLSDTVRTDDGEVVFDFLAAGDPYVPCEHATQAVDKFAWHDVYEWTHSNSLVHDPDEGLYYVLARHLDALLAIDASTGAVRWQLGGRDATRAFADPAMAFDHGHTSWVTADEAWIFDNGVHSDRPSRLVHYDLTTEPVQALAAIEESEGRTVEFLGDVRPGPGDHVFGAWTVPGDVTEHDADGRVVWRAALGRGPVLGRIRYVGLPR